MRFLPFAGAVAALALAGAGCTVTATTPDWSDADLPIPGPTNPAGAPIVGAYEVRLASDLGVTYPALAAVALDDWTTATGVTFRPVYTDDPCDPDGPACFRISLDDMAPEDCGGMPGIVGCTCDMGRQVDLDHGLSDAAMLHLLRHEVGHALGLAHDPSTFAVMFFNIDQGSESITPRDAAQYWALRGGRPR